jgi:hypothetical protein
VAYHRTSFASCCEIKVRFGEPTLQRTPATVGKLCDGQASKPGRRGPHTAGKLFASQKSV